MAHLRLARRSAEFTDKQLNLLRATYKICGERGLRALSLQRVAEAAGVSKGAILYHFKDKEELLHATMKWVLMRVAERIRQAVDRTIAPREKIAVAIDAIFIGPEANRRFYLVYLDLIGLAARSERFARLIADMRAIEEGVYAEIVRVGAAQGAFRVTDVDAAAKVVRAIIDGLFIEWLQEADWRAMHERYRTLCKRSVLAYLSHAD